MGYMDGYHPGACGHQVQDGARFCQVCGRPVPDRDTASHQDTADWTSPLATRPPGQEAPPPQQQGRAWPWVGVVTAVAVLAGGGAAAAVIALHPFKTTTAALGRTIANSGSAASHAATRQPTAAPAGTATAAPTEARPTARPTAAHTAAPPAAVPAVPAAPSGEQNAAGQVATLLAQSVSDRGAVVQAVSDVNGCGPDLASDEQTFSEAASSRASLITQLSAVPDAATLPQGLVDQLSAAWQASEAADQDFAGWAQDELNGGCTPDDSADPEYQAASGPDNDATADKQAFVAEWNPVAAQYGLTQYQWDEL